MTTKRPKHRVLVAGKFYAAPAMVGKKYLTIQLPLRVAEYFGLNRPEIFWAPVNGVIQLSATEPHITIPMMSVSPEKFLPQEPEQ